MNTPPEGTSQNPALAISKLPGVPGTKAALWMVFKSIQGLGPVGPHPPTYPSPSTRLLTKGPYAHQSLPMTTCSYLHHHQHPTKVIATPSGPALNRTSAESLPRSLHLEIACAAHLYVANSPFSQCFILMTCWFTENLALCRAVGCRDTALGSIMAHHLVIV